jgi:hypothetical protein
MHHDGWIGDEPRIGCYGVNGLAKDLYRLEEVNPLRGQKVTLVNLGTR